MTHDSYYIAMSVPDGRTVRDFLYTGLLDLLGARSASIKLFTEAVDVPQFVEQWAADHVQFAPFKHTSFTKTQRRSRNFRQQLEKRGWLVQPYRQFEGRFVFPPEPLYQREFEQQRPDLVVITNIYSANELALFNTAQHMGIPTLGIVRSWDNVHRLLYIPTDHIAVWNEVNQQEVIRFEKYAPDNVHITGAPQFDAYFKEENIWTREQLASHLDLDPDRPIIVFATMGFYSFAVEETGWMDDLLELLDDLPDRPQILCRLHPLSRLEHFLQYADHPDVRLSHVTGYIPTLGWTMSYEDMVAIGNMLRHADMLITPASTMTIEAAIFDTPTVITFYHRYQNEKSLAFFNKISGEHWRHAVENKLLPIVQDRADFLPTLQRCLTEPDWYSEQRRKLVDDFVHMTDGDSISRLADLIVTLASQRA